MQNKIYDKVVLVILDGFGIAPVSRGNAIAQADTPTFDYIASNFPCIGLQASGPLVGLPWGEMGNSEVGHLNMGAGRIVGQDLPRITTSIQTKEFFKNPAFLAAVEHVKKNNSSLHLMGMISPGGVHSLDQHLYALLGLAAEHQLSRVFIHMFMDGRDTEPKVALASLEELRQKIKKIGVGEIATLAGRFYAMDRGGHWGQTHLTYQALVDGKGETASSAEACVRQNYERQIFDEMIKPTVIVNAAGQPVAKIGDNDAVIYFNFRQDRTLQLTEMFVQPAALPEAFRRRPPQNLLFVTMTEYANNLPVQVAFPQLGLSNNLAEVLAKNKFTQFHIAESEKFAHVTSFFNCGRSEKFEGEERVIVDSPENSRNYVDHPEMSAGELTKILTDKITKSEMDFLVANFANTDMVGHTGSLAATIKAVEFVDGCLKKIMDSALLVDAVLIITADHGNAEQMINPKTGDIDKDHTTNPVPFCLIGNAFKFKTVLQRRLTFLAGEIPEGVICDIAPTILALFGFPKPPEMTGINLLDIAESKIQ